MVIIALLSINLQRKFLAHSERLPRASRGVSGYPITPPGKYLLAGCKAGCETANYTLSKRQICQSSRCMAPRGGRGETQGKASNCTLGILSMCGPTLGGAFEQHRCIILKYSFLHLCWLAWRQKRTLKSDIYMSIQNSAVSDIFNDNGCCVPFRWKLPCYIGWVHGQAGQGHHLHPLQLGAQVRVLLEFEIIWIQYIWFEHLVLWTLGIQTQYI